MLTPIVFRYDVVWWFYGHLSGWRLNFKSCKSPCSSQFQKGTLVASHTDKIKTEDIHSFCLFDHEIYCRIFNSKTADILSFILGVSSITVLNGKESSSHTLNETSDLSLVNPLPFPDQDASQSLESGVRLDGLVHFLLRRSHPRTATPWQVVHISLSLVAIPPFTDRRIDVPASIKPTIRPLSRLVS